MKTGHKTVCIKTKIKLKGKKKYLQRRINTVNHFYLHPQSSNEISWDPHPQNENWTEDMNKQATKDKLEG